MENRGSKMTKRAEELATAYAVDKNQLNALAVTKKLYGITPQKTTSPELKTHWKLESCLVRLNILKGMALHLQKCIIRKN
jgi:hypothetical protein